MIVHYIIYANHANTYCLRVIVSVEISESLLAVHPAVACWCFDNISRSERRGLADNRDRIFIVAPTIDDDLPIGEIVNHNVYLILEFVCFFGFSTTFNPGERAIQC